MCQMGQEKVPEAKSKTAGAKVTAKYEPWVLASQVDQCFFITDPSKPSRVVVRRGKRSIIGMDGAANELDLTSTAIRRWKMTTMMMKNHTQQEEAGPPYLKDVHSREELHLQKRRAKRL